MAYAWWFGHVWGQTLDQAKILPCYEGFYRGATVCLWFMILNQVSNLKTVLHRLKKKSSAPPPNKSYRKLRTKKQPKAYIVAPLFPKIQLRLRKNLRMSWEEERGRGRTGKGAIAALSGRLPVRWAADSALGFGEEERRGRPIRRDDAVAASSRRAPPAAAQTCNLRTEKSRMYVNNGPYMAQ